MQQNNAVLIRPSERRIISIGLEIEGWSTRESSRDLVTRAGGSWADDAGLNQCEMVTNPQPTLKEALTVAETMVEEQPVQLVPFLPENLKHNAKVWQPQMKYGAKVAALYNESPRGHQWLLDHMTEFASLQISFSGKFNPFGDAGAFLVSMINDIAPGYAARVHQEIRFGFGHLGLWQYFAYPERFPQPGRWFGSGAQMIRYIGTVPRLIRLAEEGSDRFIFNPSGELQTIFSEIDLGNMWWFARPKTGPYGPYIELRFLPSMDVALARPILQQVIDMMELLLAWFCVENGGQPVRTPEAALPAYRLLHRYFKEYVPGLPSDWDDWRSLMREG